MIIKSKIYLAMLQPIILIKNKITTKPTAKLTNKNFNPYLVLISPVAKGLFLVL